MSAIIILQVFCVVFMLLAILRMIKLWFSPLVSTSVKVASTVMHTAYMVAGVMAVMTAVKAYLVAYLIFSGIAMLIIPVMLGILALVALIVMKKIYEVNTGEPAPDHILNPEIVHPV